MEQAAPGAVSAMTGQAREPRSESGSLVHADLRWPTASGIGVVQSALLSRVPDRLQVADLRVRGRIGLPTSPVAITLALARRRGRGNVFWSPGFVPPAWSDLPTVVTVHDLTHLHFYTKLHRAYYESVLRPLFRRCAHVVCVSNFTRDEFLDWSKIDAGKVTTVYNGVEPQQFAQRGPLPLPFPYVLYPGNQRGYKNLRRLLQAYARTQLPADGVRLVLTGAPEPNLRATTMALRIEESVHFAGTVDRATMIGLFAHATAVAFVSLYEGFGLPLLEAMAAGVPVLASRAAALPEIAGDAALLVDPTRIDEISHGLQELVTNEDLRTRLVDKGAARVARFDWNDTAAAVWRIVSEAAA
jgi:glycosyltransferase involved in cell wall biosynthesis